MAWLKTRERKDGTVYYSVCFRENGRQGSLSWDDYSDALHAHDLINQVGPERAREIMRIIASPRQSQTLTQYLTNHVDRLTGVEKGTLARYRAYIRNDIEDGIGDIPLTVLSRDDVARWVAEMTEDGASGKTIANKHGFLAGALSVAVRDGKLEANPCAGNRLPRWDREEMVFLERDEFDLILTEIPERWKPLVSFLVASGARWSEATALKPRAVNLAAGTVRITKAWKTGGGGYTLGVPKTKKSVRTISVPTRVLEQLNLDKEWLFTNSGRGNSNPNGVVRTHSFSPNVWRPAVARAQAAGLAKSPRIHDLRHTCASWLIQSGVPLPAVQAHMGHESIKTTIDVYGHLDRESGDRVAAAMDRILGSIDDE